MTLNLESIKARLDAATKGPWKEHGLEIMTAWPVCWNLIHSSTEDGHPAVYEFKREEDAEFVANAPVDIKALINEVEHLERLYNQVNNANSSNRADADNYKSLINRIKAVCKQSDNNDGAYILRLIQDMEETT